MGSITFKFSDSNQNITYTDGQNKLYNLKIHPGFIEICVHKNNTIHTDSVLYPAEDILGIILKDKKLSL